MVSPEHSQFQTSSSLSMAKHGARTKAASFLPDGLLFVGGALVALLTVWALSSFVNPNPSSGFSVNEAKASISSEKRDCAGGAHGVNLRDDPGDPTFYDDPELSYSIGGQEIENWDEKRRDWLKHHPSYAAGAGDRILVVSGSQSSPCKNPIGDHLLLRFFKNKVDYCRIHGYDIFYNNVLLHPKMHTYWAKIPLVRAAMVAHPEAEWIWWVDSDAAFTDMDFKLPLERYKHHNLVVHGWTRMIYEEKSWVSINAGVFLIRNCQWSLDFMEVWASMGPQTPNYEKWGQTLRSALPDKLFPESDDQSGLVYLLLKEREKWGDKIYVEGEYYFEGYWLEIIGTLGNITDKYVGIEKEVQRLRRRRAEVVSENYAAMREPYLKDAGYGRWSWRRPFITHFTGCQPCSGKHNQMYEGETCWDAMQRALNFADNQVLRNYGFMHPDLLDSSFVSPLPFDFPAE
ncbi:galactomannan galactosyltransferase 1-like [Camellia sinensis]|nr:galactomannan galactosyltransferase 1-like [Camellia sinensis]XP_028111350.1 galactomannan galactosyltransferase 1-like [Camellia sinensis]XP_028111351.1 galactomannan galactosyltransferase 1-like [Camellia sinensis]